MSRRRLVPVRASLVVAAVAALSSCATPSVGNDVVAKVSDKTLTFDELGADGPGPGEGANGPAFADGDAVRAEATKWVRAQLASESTLGQSYANAYDELGVMCADLMPAPVQSADSVDEVIAQIEADGWGAVATEYEQATGGKVAFPCQSTEGIPPVFAEAFSGASPGAAQPIKDSTVGYGVVRLRPFDEVDFDEFLALVAEVNPGAIESLIGTSGGPDVYVNPRVGTYSPATLTVEPVG